MFLQQITEHRFEVFGCDVVGPYLGDDREQTLLGIHPQIIRLVPQLLKYSSCKFIIIADLGHLRSFKFDNTVEEYVTENFRDLEELCCYYFYLFSTKLLSGSLAKYLVHRVLHRLQLCLLARLALREVELWDKLFYLLGCFDRLRLRGLAAGLLGRYVAFWHLFHVFLVGLHNLGLWLCCYF